MNQIIMTHPTTESTAIPQSTASRFMDGAYSLLKGLSIVAVSLFFAVLAVRLGAAAYVHHRISNVGGEIARVSGMDSSIALWLQGPASWILTFALTSTFLRAVWVFIWPFGSNAKSLRVPLIMFAVTGLAACLPAGIEKVRGVNTEGLPAQMVEIADPGAIPWFTPEGDACVFYSREMDGSLRFWNRPGLTPDRRIESRPVTGEVRTEWERTQKAAADLKQHEAEARETAARESAAREAEAREIAAHEARESAAREAAAIESAQLERNALQSTAQPQGPVVQPPVTAPVQINAFANDPPPVPAETVPAPAPARSPWILYNVVPGKPLHIATGGRPFVIHTDVDIEVYPNNLWMRPAPVLAHRELHFPLLRGCGPMILHVLPLSSGFGTLALHYED